MIPPSNSNSIEIGCAVVKAKLDAGDSFFFIDCREQDEHELVNIEAARLLSMSEIQDRVCELEDHREDEIIVHCHHGVRSLQVALWLQQLGFANVKSMEGGIDRWAAEIDQTLLRY